MVDALCRSTRPLGISRSPEEWHRSGCLETLRQKFRTLNSEMKKPPPCTPWYSFSPFFFSFLQLTVWLVRGLLFNFRAAAPKEGIAEEFKVGDTCKPSAARNLLRQVIPLPGTLQFSSIFVPPRKIPPVKVAPFRWPLHDFFFFELRVGRISRRRESCTCKSCKRGTPISSRISF